MKALALLCLVAACHRDHGHDEPVSCLIEHDGGATQCFDEIGATARSEGESYCNRMHGAHTYRVGKACPSDGVLASCRKKEGTDLERVERCYRDPAACEARCAKSGGVLER